jgi:hypothetical protein
MGAKTIGLVQMPPALAAFYCVSQCLPAGAKQRLYFIVFLLLILGQAGRLSQKLSTQGLMIFFGDFSNLKIEIQIAQGGQDILALCLPGLTLPGIGGFLLPDRCRLPLF